MVLIAHKETFCEGEECTILPTFLIADDKIEREKQENIHTPPGSQILVVNKLAINGDAPFLDHTRMFSQETLFRMRLWQGFLRRSKGATTERDWEHGSVSTKIWLRALERRKKIYRWGR